MSSSRCCTGESKLEAAGTLCCLNSLSPTLNSSSGVLLMSTEMERYRLVETGLVGVWLGFSETPPEATENLSKNGGEQVLVDVAETGIECWESVQSNTRSG